MWIMVIAALLTAGQTVERSVSLDSLGWGAIESQAAINTDGDASTEEWLISRKSDGRWRVVAVRSGRICASDWFVVDVAFRPWSIETIDGRSKIVIQGRYDPPFVNFPLTIIRLDTPPC